MNLDQSIAEIRMVGEQLIYYNFPQADPMLEENLNRVKLKRIVVDGFAVMVHYSKANYGDRFVETVQLFSEKAPFLSFSVVSKLAKKLLGKNHLCLVEIFKDNQKIYCWNVTLNKKGVAIPTEFNHEVEICKFEDWEYAYVDQSYVNIY